MCCMEAGRCCFHASSQVLGYFVTQWNMPSGCYASLVVLTSICAKAIRIYKVDDSGLTMRDREPNRFGFESRKALVTRYGWV